jgi:hypothetical protein
MRSRFAFGQNANRADSKVKLGPSLIVILRTGSAICMPIVFRFLARHSVATSYGRIRSRPGVSTDCNFRWAPSAAHHRVHPRPLMPRWAAVLHFVIPSEAEGPAVCPSPSQLVSTKRFSVSNLARTTRCEAMMVRLRNHAAIKPGVAGK